mgnify:FL=1
MKKYNSGRVINTRLGEQMNLTLKSESLGTFVMFRKKDLLKYIKDESEIYKPEGIVGLREECH